VPTRQTRKKKAKKKTARKSAKKKTRKKAKRAKRRQTTAELFGVPAEHDRIMRLIPKYDCYRDANNCYYDAHAAQQAVDFFEQYLTHHKGALARTAFMLEDWQKAILYCLWGWKRANSTRRYRRFFLYVAKKNGKTAFCAGILLLALSTDPEIGAEIIGAASSKEQAGHIFTTAAGMVKQSPALRKRLKVYGASGGGQTKRIVYAARDSVYKVVASNADSEDGMNVHLGIVDELHRMDDSEFVDLLEDSDAARRQPLIGWITTADYNRPESPCNKTLARARGVRDGTTPDPEFLPVIYEPDPDDDWHDEATWKKANPNWGVSVDPVAFRKRYDRAKAEPSYRNKFKRLRCNIVTDASQVWVPVEKWEAGGPTRITSAEETRAHIIERVKGLPCYLGIDLSSKIDLTACTAVWPEKIDGVDHYHSMHYFWIPEDKAYEKEHEDSVPYPAWAEDGWIEMTEGEIVDYKWIKARVVALGAQFNIAEIAFDPWSALQIATQLRDDEGFETVEVRQGFKSLSEPSKLWEAKVVAGQWHHDGNPVMTWNVSNAVSRTDPSDGLKPDKQTSTQRIDGVASTITSLARAILLQGQKKSVYETRGLVMA
jgi:phage terminase large subunit-like protein